MSGRATFHTRIAAAVNHIVASQQYSSQDSAGYAPMKYRDTSSASAPRIHRIVTISTSDAASDKTQNENLKSAEQLCLNYLRISSYPPVSFYSI